LNCHSNSIPWFLSREGLRESFAIKSRDFLSFLHCQTSTAYRNLASNQVSLEPSLVLAKADCDTIPTITKFYKAYKQILEHQTLQHKLYSRSAEAKCSLLKSADNLLPIPEEQKGKPCLNSVTESAEGLLSEKNLILHHRTVAYIRLVLVLLENGYPVETHDPRKQIKRIRWLIKALLVLHDIYCSKYCAEAVK